VYIVPDTATLPTTWNVTSNDPWIKTPGAYRLGNRFMKKLDWTTFQDTLPSSFAGTRKKLVFMWINTYLQPTTPTMSVDNISIVGFNCNPPSDIVLDTITTDSARIHWRKGSNETSWILEYRRASDVAWTSRTLTDTAYSFSGLMPNTDYQVRVKAVCSGGTTYSSWARYMFHTYCLPQAIGNTQVTYNFDQYIRTIPECWTRTLPYTDEIGNTSPYVKSNTNDPDNGILVFTGKSNQIISTGEYIENMNNIEVEFSVFRESASNSGQLELGVVSDPRNPSTFVAVHDITPLITRDEQFERLNLSLASAPNGKHYIAFRQTVSSTNDNRQYGIDNLSIYKSPTCRKPNINTVTIEPTDDPTAKTVVVNWSAGGSESAWVLQYRERGSATWNTQNVSGMPTDTIRGLSPQTAYELRIK
ncbi:MAG: fibronectin type III domain-containing protein, partial [Bacteroidetes bacterium]|nr:fibronectin type III domain-containing protein [Bacteroidota bacterium]